jgi:hypothetical protein
LFTEVRYHRETCRPTERRKLPPHPSVWNWEEAKALHHELNTLRAALSESYTIDNVQIHFWQPWRSARHTEFSLEVDLANGATPAQVAAVSKRLLRFGKDFLKWHRRNGA